MTRGAGFRKEKNKKKRGSYRGGEITVGLPPFSRCDLGFLLTWSFCNVDAKSQYQVQLESLCLLNRVFATMKT